MDIGHMRHPRRNEVGIATPVGPGLTADGQVDSAIDHDPPLVAMRMFRHAHFDNGFIEKHLPRLALQEPPLESKEGQIGFWKVAHESRKILRVHGINTAAERGLRFEQTSTPMPNIHYVSTIKQASNASPSDTRLLPGAR